MLKITTPAKAEELYEAAQEYPYPMVKRALAALKNGENKDAEGILEELLGYLRDKNSFRLGQYLRELTFRIILWKQLPETEKDGVWLTEIDKYREEIALLLYKQPDLMDTFEKKLLNACEGATKLAAIHLKNTPVLIPSQEDIFETEHHWEWYFTKKNEQEK
jgi:hypothetical protein